MHHNQSYEKNNYKIDLQIACKNTKAKLAAPMNNLFEVNNVKNKIAK